MKTKNFKICILILRVVNHQNRLDASPPLSLKISTIFLSTRRKATIKALFAETQTAQYKINTNSGSTSTKDRPVGQTAMLSSLERDG